MSEVLTPLAGLSVLIVEDEPLVAIMIEDFAKDLGCRSVITVGSVSAALETIENLSPDLVILDVLMTDGEPDFTVADDLAERQIPLIFCSGHMPDVIDERHRHRPFLSKPFSHDELLAAIVGCDPARASTPHSHDVRSHSL